MVVTCGCQGTIQGGPPGFIHQQGMPHAQPFITPACVTRLTPLVHVSLSPTTPCVINALSEDVSNLRLLRLQHFA